MTDERGSLLRHTVATLAYRGGKAVRGAPPAFATFRASAGSRTPGQILAHLGDLLDWALPPSRGERVWKDSEPLPWAEELARFFPPLPPFPDPPTPAHPLPP